MPWSSPDPTSGGCNEVSILPTSPEQTEIGEIRDGSTLASSEQAPMRLARHRTSLAIVAYTLLLLGCSPTYKRGLTRSGIHGGGLPPQTVILTYDDGPDEHTRELALFLQENGIHGTFFINGRRICKAFDPAGHCLAAMDSRPCGDGGSQASVDKPQYYPESLLDDLIELGHRVANHSEDHCNLTGERSTDDIIFELETTQAILDRHVPDGVFLFRPPYGAWDEKSLARAHASGSLDKLTGPVFWDIDGEDYACWHGGRSVEECGAGYLARLNARPLRNGIFLMHDRPEFNVGYEGPVLLTKWLVPRLKQAGYKFSDMDDLLDVSAHSRERDRALPDGIEESPNAVDDRPGAAGVP